jgi:hypothetical protein
MTQVRKGQAPAQLSRTAFHERFMQSFVDPAFRSEDEALARVEALAWDAYKEGRKAPVTRKAGMEFADPEYDLSTEWLETRARLHAAGAAWKDPATPSRVLLICGSSRNDGTCPGEISKTWRLLNVAKTALESAGMHATCWTSAC